MITNWFQHGILGQQDGSIIRGKNMASMNFRNFAFERGVAFLVLIAGLMLAGPGNAATLAGGESHTVTLKDDGTVWTLGYNATGQLGNGSVVNSSTPVQVTGLTGVTGVAAGYGHSVALKSDGTVWTWGYNALGQLGNGTATNSSTPVQVSGLTGVTAIAAGQYQTVALKGDGTVWAWGANNLGQLGYTTSATCSAYNSYPCSLSAAQVTGVSDVTAIAAGAAHTIALTSSATVWAWGANLNGQLGNGSISFALATPAQVAVLTNVTAIASGGAMYHSIALKGDGTVWTWGYNGSGQLGNGTTVNAATPVQVSSITGVTAIAGGKNHSLALVSGSVWAWGENSQGALGNGSTVQSSTPVQVSGLASIISIAAGGYHGEARKSDGTVWGWGKNDYGQLGNGVAVNSSNAVEVLGSGGTGFLNLGSAPPVCTLTVSPTTITAGASATLSASCMPTATSYVWSNSGFGSTVASGSVSPAISTTYSVKGSNGSGSGNTAITILTVNPAVPVCTLNASPNLITTGGSTYLFAKCTPAASSYAWTNSGFAATTAGGKVTPASTTTYSVIGSNASGSSSSASATVTVGASVRTEAQALFINASTSTNKTSVLRVINTTAVSSTLTASAFDESGVLLGSANASLGAITANQTLSFTSASLESLLGFSPSAPTAKYAVYVYSGLSAFQIINYTSDIATGALTLSQSLYADRSSASTASSVTRTAWFVSSSTSANKTNVLRIINTSSQSGTLSATVYDENGSLFGSGNISLGSIAARQMFSYTSAQLESALGYTPVSSTAKYRVIFTANVPSLELINFTKDIATGNLALVQAQTDDRPASGAITSTRNVLLVNPSNSISRNTVLRIVNPNASIATITASAYDETGSVVGSGSLGSIAANAILALTSAQIEAAMVYTPSSTSAKYRLLINANVPGIEVIDDTKLPTNGNLYLAQAQTDNRAASGAGSTTRNAYIIYPQSSASTTTEVRITNTTGASAALTATAYDDSGTLIASGRTIGTLGTNQMLTFSSAQLETLFGYTPPSGTAKWRIVFSAPLTNFELVNYTKEVAGGLLVLAQPQTE
jgi:alpha-tubulin suppressor-like RCC1 family protein